MFEAGVDMYAHKVEYQSIMVRDGEHISMLLKFPMFIKWRLWNRVVRHNLPSIYRIVNDDRMENGFP
jgi:hypothetical protein